MWPDELYFCGKCDSELSFRDAPCDVCGNGWIQDITEECLGIERIVTNEAVERTLA